jgi:cytochrome c
VYFTSGKKPAGEAARFAGLVAAGPANPLAAATPMLDAAAEYETTFPFPVTADVLERGRERYMIFCVVCHGADGTGNGKIVQRGYTRPPSFITDESRGLARRGRHVLLREVPVGYIFEVPTNGYGAMPDYRSQVPPRDRWSIVAFIRVLQLSQYARLADLPEKERRATQEALGGKP